MDYFWPQVNITAARGFPGKENCLLRSKSLYIEVPSTGKAVGTSNRQTYGAPHLNSSLQITKFKKMFDRFSTTKKKK